MARTKSVRLGREEMDLIKLFTAITGVNTLDCCILHEEELDGTINDRIVFMVNSRDLSKSVGKNGINVKKLKEKLSKNIDIIAFSKDLESSNFVKNPLSSLMIFLACKIGVETTTLPHPIA